MSSHDDGDTDINVVSSPEPSPCPSPTNPASSNRPHSDDEAAHIPYSHLHHITRHNSSRPLSITNLTSNNNSTSLTNGDSRLSPSKTPPDTPNSGTNSVLNSPNNNLSSHNNNNNNTTTSTKNSGFTSFSISNILSRSDSANNGKSNDYLTKKSTNGTMPTTNINVTTTLGPLGHAAGIHGPHDAAMLSR